MRIVNVAKVIVQRPNGDVLLLRRSQTDPRRPGEWDIPGGGVEHGESHMQAAIRETNEEAGLVVSALTVLYAGTELYEPKQESVNRILYLARIADDPIVTLSLEHDAKQWLPLDQVETVFTHPFYTKGLMYAVQNKII